MKHQIHHGVIVTNKQKFKNRKMRGHTHPVHLEDNEKCVKTLEKDKKILGSIVVGCDNAFLSVITSHAKEKCHYLPK